MLRQQITESAAQRWPWLVSTTIANRLEIRSDMLTMVVDLEWQRDSGRVRVNVASSTCISGDVADAAEASRQVAEVVTAALFVHGQVSGLTVWQDGECPCSYCSGRGTSQGRTCERCSGKGKV